VSHDFGFGDWRPDAEETVPVPDKPVEVKKESTIRLWIVPARVAENGAPAGAGWPRSGFRPAAEIQDVSGTVTIGGAACRLSAQG